MAYLYVCHCSVKEENGSRKEGKMGVHMCDVHIVARSVDGWRWPKNEKGDAGKTDRSAVESQTLLQTIADEFSP